jgi:hypothetical protein
VSGVSEHYCGFHTLQSRDFGLEGALDDQHRVHPGVMTPFLLVHMKNFHPPLLITKSPSELKPSSDSESLGLGVLDGE